MNKRQAKKWQRPYCKTLKTKRQAKKWQRPQCKPGKWIGWGAVGLGFWPWARHSADRIGIGTMFRFPRGYLRHVQRPSGWDWTAKDILRHAHPRWTREPSLRGVTRNSPAWLAAWAYHAKQWG